MTSDDSDINEKNDLILKLDDVTTGYDGKAVLKNINLSVYKKDFLGIIGPNGGGKTTLIKTILELVPPISGKIITYRNGKKVNDLRIGYLPQVARIDTKFPVTAQEMILSGLAHQRNWLRRYKPHHRELLEETIERVGIKKYAHKPVGNLSGGELQRVLLGRAIIARPELLILDEPSTYIDKPFEEHFFHLLDEINKESAIILISHDIGTIISQVKNIACINNTLYYHKGNQVTTQWLEKGYGCPFELVGHGHYPHRVLSSHDDINLSRASSSPATGES
ncbi:MAG: ABC transporter ATP-binding protein [Bacteroidales bacterium]|nr:ABC transporter ATP-binding protein [Bacteroidales bacterium]